MFYHTHFTCSTIHIVPYMFSEIADRNWNCKGVKLPSGCVVPGSRSFHTFGCCFVNWRGGLMRWTISGFLVLLGWAPCQVGTGLVEFGWKDHTSKEIIPSAACSQQKQTFHMLLFLCLCDLLTFKYECLCDRFYCRQCYHSCAGFFKWYFIDFLWETVCGMLLLMCMAATH